MDAVQEVKSRLNIEDIVAEYVELKRAGRNFKGLSPFTSEKSPSFIVSPEKQIWHDFSSGKGGDVISFIEQVEGLDFKGALALLARKAGVDISMSAKSPHDSGAQKERLFEAVEAAVHFYQKQLTKHDVPLRYLRETRKYSKQTILDFRFGFAPLGKDSLTQYLKGLKFTEDELVRSGLCVRRGSDVVDMFRGRITLPLSDAQGRAVGFTARQLEDAKDGPKYINTPATVLYDKSRQLYGLHLAKEHIRKSGYVVVVEGNLDVVASHQAGVRQVVASAGTALTPHHLKILQRFTGDIRLAFDDDRAGQTAAMRTIPLAQGLGIELSIITIPAGKDPDELIRNDVTQWQKAVDAAQYMVDWVIDKMADTIDITSAQGKRLLTTESFALVRDLKDDVEKEHYLRLIAKKTSTSYESIRKKFDQQPIKHSPHLKPIKQSEQSTSAHDAEHRLREQHLLSIVSTVPALRTYIDSAPKEIYSEEAAQFVQRLQEGSRVENSDEYGKMLSLLFEETYQHTEQSELVYQTEQLLRRLIDFYITTEKTNILKQLEAQPDEATEQQLLSRITALEKLRTN